MVYCFDGYVAAHWNDELVHKCLHCQRRHRVLAGVVTLLVDPEPDKKKTGGKT